MYIINCLLEGDPKSFSVDIDQTRNVNHLRDSIKAKNAETLKGVDARTLNLYHLNFQYDESNEQERTIQVNKVLQDLSKKNPLSGIRKLSNLKEGFPDEVVHIFVTLPQLDPLTKPSQKRQRSDIEGADEEDKTRKRPSSLVQSSNLAAFYQQAWGKQWPLSKATITKAEISGESDEDPADEDPADEEPTDEEPAGEEPAGDDPAGDDVGRALADMLAVPCDFTYECLRGLKAIKVALGNIDDNDVLVIREEYGRLYEKLKTSARTSAGTSAGTIRGITVTGHPGIGKTTFLYYVLLRRLEHKLPTAVQLDSEEYYIFDKKGVTVHSLLHQDDRLGQCWALADSSVDVGPPCRVFRSMAQCVIQMTSPKPERWKEWIKQAEGTWVVMNPPSVPEIAAMLKELGYKSSSTLSFVRKYGPSTRQAIRCALPINSTDAINSEAITNLDRGINDAVQILCKEPLNAIGALGLPRHEGSSVVFVFRLSSTVIRFADVKSFIPTPHLREIFETACSNLTNQSYLDLFYAFSLHSVTRTAAGWAHEKIVHARLGQGGTALKFVGNRQETMVSSTRILPGSIGGLQQARVGDSFYWIPSSSNFVGVDSVLGTQDQRVYCIQATIATDHKDPMEGIKKVWAACTKELRSECTWHYVVVANTEPVAQKFVTQFATKLRGFRLGKGKTRTSVEVWGCVVRFL